MSSSEYTEIPVPIGLRDMLLDFTTACLLEQPDNIVDFAAQYFTQLKQQQALRKSGSYVATQRRFPICAEPFDPENDNVEINREVVRKTSAELRKLHKTVDNLLVFRSLDKEQIQTILDAMTKRKVVKNEVIIMEGDEGDNFYVIHSGKFRATKKADKSISVIKDYDNEGSFGELALMYNVPRAATITAITNGFLWVLDGQTFRQMSVQSTFQKKQTYDTFIESVPMLKQLKPNEKTNLADALQPQYYRPGDAIIKQHEAARGMYFIEEGTVKVEVHVAGRVKEIGKLTKGQYFGERALITKTPRAASVIAINNVKVAFLDVNTFERLLGPCMDIMKRNIAEYDETLKELQAQNAL